MKTNMKLVLLYVVTVIGLLSLTACGDSPEAARKKLAGMGIDYSADQFVFAANKGDMVAVKAFLDAGMAIDTPMQLEDSTETALSAACSMIHRQSSESCFAFSCNIYGGVESFGKLSALWDGCKKAKRTMDLSIVTLIRMGNSMNHL